MKQALDQREGMTGTFVDIGDVARIERVVLDLSEPPSFMIQTAAAIALNGVFSSCASFAKSIRWLSAPDVSLSSNVGTATCVGPAEL